MSPAAAAAPAACIQRLADQLQSLSEVAETLTLRLLDLEDRLSAHELQLQPFLIGPGDGPDQPSQDGTGLRLTETEERLARLETLLNGEQGGSGPRRLHAVEARQLDGDRHAADREEEIDPFPTEEIDPPFLDELEERSAPEALTTLFDQPFELERHQA